MAEIHNTRKRMPLILPKDAYSDWLSGSADQAENWLTPYPSDIMDAYRISTYVNYPEHNDPRCIAELAQ